jgi:hypothetical protein
MDHGQTDRERTGSRRGFVGHDVWVAQSDQDDAQLRSWWAEASTFTALRASAQLVWPTFLEWHDCVFFVPPTVPVEEWQEWVMSYGPPGWQSLPLLERQEAAAQLGEFPLNHLPRVHELVDVAPDVDPVDALFDILLVSWQSALAAQFPGRTFVVESIDRGDGLTVRLTETTGTLGFT